MKDNLRTKILGKVIIQTNKGFSANSFQVFPETTDLLQIEHMNNAQYNLMCSHKTKPSTLRPDST